VVAAIANHADLPLVLVAGAQAQRLGAALVLVHVTAPRSRRSDPGIALRDRALTLARLTGVEATWTPAIGRADAVLARMCRDYRAALIVVGASRRELATWRRHRVLAAARRLKRRSHTPIHIITT
jgi:K+-sensing histidine kinase KdpD